LEIVGSILGFLKDASGRMFTILSFAVGFILFADDRWLLALGLKSFRDEYLSYLGAIFIVSFSGLTVTIIFFVGRVVEPWWNGFMTEQRNSRLKRLFSGQQI